VVKDTFIFFEFLLLTKYFVKRYICYNNRTYRLKLLTDHLGIIKKKGELNHISQTLTKISTKWFLIFNNLKGGSL
jgi:hypothetical protein